MQTPFRPPAETIPAGERQRRQLRVHLAAPRGFCAGVRRAIDAVTAAIDRFGAPVYVRHAIVHNGSVIRELEAQGAIFVEDLDEVPVGSVAILSAHGVSVEVMVQGEARSLKLIDATCPLVAKIHREVERHHRDGRHIFLIGHPDHPEIVGTLGRIPDGAATVVSSSEQIAAAPWNSGDPAAYAIQTTYSTDEARDLIAALKARFVDLAGPQGSDICYATSARQAAVTSLASVVDAMLVAGETYSSNASRLAETARRAGCASVQLVADPEAISFELLDGAETIGITAAASTPERIVQSFIDALQQRFEVVVEEMPADPETVSFKQVAFA